jgi:cytochrome P450
MGRADNFYSFYTQARREEPIFFSPLLNMWVVRRYDDVKAILNDHLRFSSENALEQATNYTPETLEILRDAVPFSAVLLVNADPPRHTRGRACITKAFSARRVASLEPRIRQFADRLIDQFIADRQADLVTQFAYPHPMLTILSLIGVPEEDIEQVKAWCEDELALLFGLAPPERQAACARSFVAYQRYVADLIEQRRIAPQDDLTSDLLKAIDEGTAELSRDELIQMVAGLVAAGYETTANLLGGAAYHLLREPRHWQAICADPSRIPAVVEELLRFDSPSLGMFRFVTEEAEIGGVRLPQGARVHILFGSANHDEAYFANPEEFDPQRANVARHIAFGYGIHFCSGAALVRLEARVALEQLSTRLPSLRLAAGREAIYEPMLLARGLKHLAVEWDG